MLDYGDVPGMDAAAAAKANAKVSGASNSSKKPRLDDIVASALSFSCIFSLISVAEAR